MRKSDEVYIDIPKNCVLQAIALAMAMESSEGEDVAVWCIDDLGDMHDAISMYKNGNLKVDDWVKFKMDICPNSPVFICEGNNDNFAIPAKYGLEEEVYGIIPTCIASNRFKVAKLVVVKIIASMGNCLKGSIQSDALFKDYESLGCSPHENTRCEPGKTYFEYEYYCVEYDKWQTCSYFRLYKKKECELFKNKEDILL